LSDNNGFKQIIESFDKVLEGERQLLEDEIRSNIQHSLQTILKKLD
jgi:BMFP domain-containing protein YqiC